MTITTDPFKPFTYDPEHFAKERVKLGLGKFNKKETFFEKRRKGQKRYTEIYPMAAYINKNF